MLSGYYGSIDAFHFMFLWRERIWKGKEPNCRRYREESEVWTSNGGRERNQWSSLHLVYMNCSTYDVEC